MFMLWHQLKMEKITTFICAINFTYLPYVSLFCLRIIYTKGKFHPSKPLYRKYFPEDKTQTNLQNWEKFEEKHPMTFAGMYQIWVFKTKIWLLKEHRMFYFYRDRIKNFCITQSSKPLWSLLLIGKKSSKKW